MTMRIPCVCAVITIAIVLFQAEKASATTRRALARFDQRELAEVERVLERRMRDQYSNYLRSEDAQKMPYARHEYLKAKKLRDAGILVAGVAGGFNSFFAALFLGMYIDAKRDDDGSIGAALARALTGSYAMLFSFRAVLRLLIGLAIYGVGKQRMDKLLSLKRPTVSRKGIFRAVRFDLGAPSEGIGLALRF